MSLFGDKRRFTVVIVVLLLFVLMSMPFSFTRFVRARFYGVIAPVLKIVKGVCDRGSMAITVIFTTRNPHNQLEQLQRELTHKESELTALKSEVERLESVNLQLDQVEAINYLFIPSTIIGREPNRWYNGATLDKGSRSGVVLGQAVVEGKKFVGRISEVGKSWSRVRFIIDPTSSIPGQLENSGHTGLVTGTSSTVLKLDYIAIDTPLNPGEAVFTAYFANPKAKIRAILPAGFIIGRIKAVTRGKEGWYQAATITPACDFQRLNSVLIIKSE